MLPLPEAADGHVRCGNCGLLGKIKPGHDDAKIVNLRERITGRIDGGGKPFCSVESPAFDNCEGKLGKPEPLMAESLKENRKCDQYYPWMKLHSPKEHMELKYADFLRQESERRDREMREWQADQSRLASEREDSRILMAAEREDNRIRLAAERAKTQRDDDRIWQNEQRIDTIEASKRNARINSLFTGIVGMVLGIIGTAVIGKIKPDQPPVIQVAMPDQQKTAP